MGHHARTLTACVAVLAASLVVAANASAYNSIIRVETRQMNSIGSGAFVPRQAVAVPGQVQIADAADPATTATCPADSPAAALQTALAAQVKFAKESVSGNWLVTSIKNVATGTLPTPPASPPWSWRVYVDQGPIDNGGLWNAGNACASPPYPSENAEVLVYQACGTANGNTTRSCFGGTPLYMKIRDGGPYDIAPQTVPGRGAPVVVKTIGDKAPASALLGTDESSFTPVETTVNSPLVAEGKVSFTEYGPHQVIAVEKANGNRPPARMTVCASEGNDGYCGSTKVPPPAEIPYDPSPCTTNGHDGFCGTTDTSGPVTHVTNIINKKVYKAKKGPGQVKGTIDTDPNGVGKVQLRLTRVLTTKVKVKVKTKKKTKKPRYRTRTVKRCTSWNDVKALLVTTKCGTKYAQWFKADLSDLRNEFSYSFALTLPKGTYTLEVLADDEDGHKDGPAPGRNVLVFTVS